MVQNSSRKIYPAALFLGFLSAFIQFTMIGEFLLRFGEQGSTVDLIIFSWIFLTGLGSYLAMLLEKKTKPAYYLFLALLLLAIFPQLSQYLLAVLSPDILITVHQDNITGFVLLTLVVLAPVCLLNGLLFSILSQMMSEKKIISRIYAWESVGTLIAGLICYFLINYHLVNFSLLGLATICLAVFISVKSVPIRKILVFITVTLAFWALFAILPVPKAPETASVPVNTEVYAAATCNSAATNSVSEISVLRLDAGNIFDYRNIVAMVLFLGFAGYFINVLRITGRTIFIAGFSCLAFEIIFISVFSALLGSLQKASGIVISIFMAGLVLGYASRISNSKDMKLKFTSVVKMLAGLAVVAFGLLYAWQTIAEPGFIIGLLLAITGFCFALMTGLIFSYGVRLESGSNGKIVALTYGADMLGSSLGALVVSSVLVPALGIRLVVLFIVLILVISCLVIHKS